ncbi:hypothetical protein ACFE04_028043 [Oxalis oulophora]
MVYFDCFRMQNVIQRYKKYTKEMLTDKPLSEQHVQQLKQDAEIMGQKIQQLEISKRKLMGQGLGSCSTEELQQIDTQLEKSLRTIRARKEQLFRESLENFKAKERAMLDENKRLNEMCGSITWHPSICTQPEKGMNSSQQSSQNSEVVTELFIGLPDTRCRS